MSSKRRYIVFSIDGFKVGHVDDCNFPLKKEVTQTRVSLEQQSQTERQTLKISDWCKFNVVQV